VTETNLTVVDKKLKKPEWEYQEWESAADYQAFVVYRDLGPSRTQTDAAILLGYVDNRGKATTGGSVRLSKLSKKNLWDKRIAAMIDYQQKRIFDAETKERITQKRQAVKLYQTMKNALAKPLEVYIRKINAGEITFDKLSDREFIDVLCQVTNKLALVDDTLQKIYGEPTDIHSINGEISNKIEIEIKHSKYELADTGD